MNKAAIVVLSDPNSGTEEASGYLFNALATAYDYKQAGEEVKILFQGTGTRWPEQLKKNDNPFHQLYLAVEDKVEGVSAGCAAAFGAESSGLSLVKGNAVPGTEGLPSLVELRKEGYEIVIF